MKIKTLFVAMAMALCAFASKAEGTPENNPQEFDNWFLQYSSDPEYFDKGFYGIGWVVYNESGFGGTLSAHGNWGIVDKGNIMFKFGPAYGYALSPHFMVNTSLRGFICTYEDYETSDQKISGGITLTPGITLRYNKIMLNAGFEFGWAHKSHELYKSVEIGIGYNF